MAGNTTEPGVGQAERILRLLKSFDAGHRYLTLTQIVRRSGIPKSTCHRMITELLRLRMLDLDERGRYSVGSAVWEIGLHAPVEHDIRRAALPFMQDLLTATRQVVNLFTLDEDSALLVERIAGSSVGDPIAEPGDRLSLRTSAAGKVFLAFSPTANNQASDPVPAALSQELRLVRRQGWATTAEEHSAGAWGLAVPIPQDPGTPMAALGVVALTPIRDPQRVVPALRVTAAAIARSMLRRTSED